MHQIDLIFFPKHRSNNSGATKFLLRIEIPNRKACAYPVKSKKSEALLDAYEKFVKEQDGHLIDVYGDDEFKKQ